ncbi:glycosyltransferase [Chryseosolibacter indicus]|uniref:Glycosyltransferase n=1 Tax=Chryseosolibacter indicus TaxID=2782351 RepID=A0ABS5VN24_9BACT|nr:glycosyltransferase [Chryseosolibacter indicus]MBT1702843.1 glycosyltransferase [Chryseosolibacter indicus]
MNRLSDKYKILFIEEPDDKIVKKGSNFSIKEVNDNLSVLTPHFKWDDWKVMCPQYVSLLKEHVHSLTDSIFWFYSPLYVHILNSVTPSMVIYDCMDELSAFRHASPNLPRYERQLMGTADLVFTGGKSLYESKKELHPEVHCFPSSVDREHFLLALQEETEIPNDLLELKKPIAGFYGVIDERLDFQLLKEVADKLPDVNFVMIGPFAKIGEDDAAKAPNIFYLGKKEYPLLPKYLKGIDVAIMPFAINEATRFISPTKTLEFMAALKPIVSTPIHDVVRDYKHAVSVASDADAFAKSIDKFLKETANDRNKREKDQQEIIQKTSWDNTVIQMLALIAKAQDAVAFNAMKA